MNKTLIPSIKRFLFLIVFLVMLLLHYQVAFPGADSTITLIAAGDLMLANWAEEEILKNGFDYPFHYLDSLFASADIIFANLEAPFTTAGEPFPKSYNFRVNPDLVEVLSHGRINLVSLANNHILDYGVEGLTETIQLLGKKYVAYAGAGQNLKAARQPALLKIKGQKIAFVAYSLTFPEEFWATDSSAGTCFPSHTFVYRDIRRLKSENDLVIVSCHWGEELSPYPKKYQKQLAHQLIDAGADVILGHHPHVIQGIEMYRNKIIAYSLGNFIFGSFSENVKVGLLLKLTINAQSLMDCEIVPINVYNKEVLFQPRPLEGEAKARFLDYLQNISRELNISPIVISSDRIKIAHENQ